MDDAIANCNSAIIKSNKQCAPARPLEFSRIASAAKRAYDKPPSQSLSAGQFPGVGHHALVPVLAEIRSEPLHDFLARRLSPNDERCVARLDDFSSDGLVRQRGNGN